MNTAQDVSIFCELQIKWRINVFPRVENKEATSKSIQFNSNPATSKEASSKQLPNNNWS